ncbi:putative ribonuclease H-like domain-containing protein [Tanacetum coccineum]|uniref:Ribonuclease H-like domain-containing protein n=1 Tax=Tanacetum coccineum TaxID=301880 RepID=A0ABQ5E254_9ASTR
MKGILRQFSIARTPQQNGVAERRNRTLIEAVRTMLADSNLPTTFWAEVVNNVCKDQSLMREEPKKVIHALKDPSWIEAMQEELLQFKLQEVWTLVDLPNGKRAIGTKWVFRNKKDERGIVIRNKARLVAQGYIQEEWIDYDEVFVPVVRIEAIRLFLAYASFKDFVVYQMDVKSDFLYEKIEEEVFTEVNTASTLMETQKPLLKDEDGEEVDVCMYRYLKGQPKLGLWYPKDSPFDLVAYTDSDYARESLDRKSTTIELYLILLGKAKKSVKLMMEKHLGWNWS